MIVPARKKITPVIAAQLLQRRSQGASARALEPEFDISNQAIGKFFKKEDATRAAELEHGNQQTPKRQQADRSSRDPASRPAPPQPQPADSGPPLAAGASQPGQRRAPKTTRPRDPYQLWLDTPKNLSGRRALAEAQGFARVRNPQGTIHCWREHSEIDALLQSGWQLA